MIANGFVKNNRRRVNIYEISPRLTKSPSALADLIASLGDMSLFKISGGLGCSISWFGRSISWLTWLYFPLFKTPLRKEPIDNTPFPSHPAEYY